jgi:hypothetical protein
VEDLHGAERPLQDLLVDGRGAEQVLLLLVRRPEHLGLGEIDARQVLVALVHLVEALERGGRVEVRRVELEDAPVVRDRALDVAQVLLADLRGLDVQRRGELRVLD